MSIQLFKSAYLGELCLFWPQNWPACMESAENIIFSLIIFLPDIYIMSCEIRKWVQLKELRSPVPMIRTGNDAKYISLAESASQTISFKFSLPRSAVTAAGCILKACTLSYKIESGTLSGLAGTIEKWTLTDGSTVSSASTVSSTESGEELSNTTNLQKYISTVDTPAYDNDGSGVNIEYSYSVVFTANTASVVHIYGAEVVYDFDVKGGSQVATAITTDSDITESHFGKVVPVEISGGNLTLDLFTAAADKPAVVTIKVTVSDGNDLIIAHDGGNENIIGFGSTGGTLTISSAAVGDYVTLMADYSTNGLWAVVEARASSASIA